MFVDCRKLLRTIFELLFVEFCFFRFFFFLFFVSVLIKKEEKSVSYCPLMSQKICHLALAVVPLYRKVW